MNQWRNLLFFLLLVTELHLLLGPSYSTHQPSRRTVLDLPTQLLSSFTGDRPPFIQIRLLHRLFASLSVGISQLAGVWSSDGQGGRKPGLEDLLAAVRGLESEGKYGIVRGE